jgi:hypothetical protein
MSDDTKPETGSGAQRPHATLDLKAEHVDAPETEQTAAGETETSTTGTRAAGDAAPQREGGGAAGFLTHLAAGLLGGLIALVVGYYALGNFRDRLPFVSETSAEQIKTAQEKLEQRIVEVAGNSGAARAQLADRVSALDARTEGLAQTDEEAVASLTARVDALERQLQTATDTTDDTARAEQIANVRGRLATLEESISTLRASLDEVRAQSQENVAAARASALAVALNNLQRAVDSGAAYAAELQAVRDLSAEPLEADTLTEAAQNGVPTLRKLRQDFPRYANAALDAVGATGDDSIIGQIVESARSVVNVRPVGEIEGDSPRAIIARVENRLKAGDLSGVVAQSDQLSGEAAVQLLPWIEQVKTRINANQELNALESRMLAAIRQ